MPAPPTSGTFVTACPRNCYSTCGLRVSVEGGRVRRIEPLAENLATAGGACLKGLSYIERVYSPDRLLYPLRRQAASGTYRRVSWDAAFDEIAARLAATRARLGAQSVLFYAGSGTKGLLNAVSSRFWRLFGGCTTTYGDLCWPAGLEATRLTLGDNAHNAPWDLANACLIVFWGKNPAETNIHQMPFLERALDAGARLVVIDPRRTETAERAALLIQPRPGTDGALALAAAHVLVDRGWIDETFVARHVLGFEPFREYLRTCTPAWAAGVCGIPERQVHLLAEWLGAIRPATICAGFGMQRFTNSGQAMRAMIALLALTGNVGRPGAGWMFANLATQVFGAHKDPLDFYPPATPDGVLRVSISTALLGPQMLETRDPPLTVAWVERGNPIPQNPETTAVLRAFRALEFRVVVDEFLTDTAREADIVLPAKTLFEQTDVIGAYWHDYLQLRQKVIEPPGEVKPETEIYWHLAHRLGFPRDAIEAAIPAPGDEAIEAYLAAQLARLPGITLAQLRQGPVRVPGAVDVAFADLAFPTPSGRIELLSAEARARWGLDELPTYREPRESALGEDGDPSRFPLSLLTPNTKDRIHSQFGNLPSIRTLSPAPLVALHPADARARGIRAGDRVRLFNARGSLHLDARIDHGLRRGCVTVHNGWWLTDGGAVNVLSKARETDMGFGAAFHENLVEVERA
jgi:anaerobic selenocysteine-containing dehydrogenase